MGLEESSEGAEEEGVVLLGPELGYIEDCGFSFGFAFSGKRDGVDDFVNGTGWEDDGDCVGFSPLGADRSPEGADMRCSPGAVGHDNVDGATDATVEIGEQMPISFFEGPSQPLARAGVKAFAKGWGGVKRAEHVGRYCGIMHVGPRGDSGKEEFGKGKGEGVAHCVNENVGYDQREGIIC